jgi:hypothetical protein
LVASLTTADVWLEDDEEDSVLVSLDSEDPEEESVDAEDEEDSVVPLDSEVPDEPLDVSMLEPPVSDELDVLEPVEEELSVPVDEPSSPVDPEEPESPPL